MCIAQRRRPSRATSRRRQQAEQLGDFGLVNDLEDIISDETKHKEAIEMILRGL